MSKIQLLIDKNNDDVKVYPKTSLSAIYDLKGQSLATFIDNVNDILDKKVADVYKKCESILSQKIEKSELYDIIKQQFSGEIDYISYLNILLSDKPYITYTTSHNQKLSNANIQVFSDYIIKHIWVEHINTGIILVSDELTEFPDNMFFDCTSLVTIEFQNFTNITAIGNKVLAKRNYTTAHLKSVIFGDMPACKKIGENFLAVYENYSDTLYGYKELTNIDLSAFHNVETISYNFLRECENITSIDLTPFSNVKSIGQSFLAKCKRLNSLDTTPLSNLQLIASYFLDGAVNLKEINLSGLKNMTSLMSYFLRGCKNLKHIDLSPLSKISNMYDNNILEQCTGLTSIISPMSFITQHISKDIIPNIIELTLLGNYVHTIKDRWTLDQINKDLMIYVQDIPHSGYISYYPEIQNRFYEI